MSFVRRKDGVAPGRGMKARAVEGIVWAVSVQWTHGPQVNVVQSVTDLPAPILNAVRKAETEGDVLGLYAGGQVYIIADRMNDQTQVHSVLLHEVIGHHGLRLIMTEGERARALNAAWMCKPPQVSAIQK